MSNLSTKQYFAQEAVQGKFKQLLGERSPQFVSSVLQSVANNYLLKKAEPSTVYMSAMMAASLDLPINQNLGFAWIVPYKNNRTQTVEAQFQMGWKGYVQLAQRSGQYKAINVVEIYENQFKSFNPLTEEFDADFNEIGSGKIVGYVAYFKMVNGFEKTIYWTREKVEAHGKRYSKSFSSGPWKTDFDSMAKKTVLKNLLSKFGILSIELQPLQKSIEVDQAVIKEDGSLEYIDNDSEDSSALIVPDEKEFHQIKEGLKMGAASIDQIKLNYDLNNDQLTELETLVNLSEDEA